MSGDKNDAIAMLYQELKHANEVLSPQEIAAQVVAALGDSVAIATSNQIIIKATGV